MGIRENIVSVRKKIEEACKRVGRNPNEVVLMGVTKMVAPHYINEAIDSGIKVIGENRVQEARDKFDKVKKGVKWHMIGPLQVNKVKYAVHIFDMIQSLESVKLADEIEKRASSLERPMEVLVEIKTSFEETKHGISPLDLIPFLKRLSNYRYLKVKGLMTMAPLLSDPELTRPYFRQTKELFDKVKEMNIPNIEMEILSMGMSGDFEIAIEEGSTLVRVGRAIFQDVYKK